MDKNNPESYYIQDGVAKSKIFGAPILVDEVSEELIYVAHANINNTTLIVNPKLLIKKITTIGTIIETKHAYGAWEDRETLEYIGY